MNKILIGLTLTLGACSLFQGKEDEQSGERYVWVNGPIKHPVTGKTCTIGYCEGEPVPAGKSGCHSETYRDKCPLKK
jgi:hypothetical protein